MAINFSTLRTSAPAAALDGSEILALTQSGESRGALVSQILDYIAAEGGVGAQDNMSAAADPTATDDSDAGYRFGSRWVNTSSSPAEIFMCIDATVGAAVWVKTTLTLDELGTAAVASAERLSNSPYCSDTGAADAYVLSVNYADAAPTAYNDGDQYRFRAGASNTGASTVNINGLGAKTLVTVTGVALPAGYIRTDVDTTITYDAANDRFVADREVETVPTATGGYTRWASGEMTCRGTHEDASTSASGLTATYATVFPAAFSETPLVDVRELQPTQNLVRIRAQVSSGPTTTGFDLRYVTVTDGEGTGHLISVGDALAAAWTADGFWYSS